MKGSGRKAQKKLLRIQQSQGEDSKLLHGEWCTRNFVSGRALAHAYDVRSQLAQICGRGTDQNGLGMDVSSSCGEDNMEIFLKCACAGLFLQAAARLPAPLPDAPGVGGAGLFGFGIEAPRS